MKTHRLLLRSTFVIAIGLIISSAALFYENGAPSYKTGSPGDFGNNCAGCHQYGPAATNQTVSIEVVGMDSTIMGGQTYEIKVSANGPTHTKIGFESTVEADMDSTKIGSFAVSGTNMQIKDAVYATHIGSGTNAVNGETSWSYQWTAPTGFSGAATIYAAALFSNNDNENSGDITLTTSKSISISDDLNIDELVQELNLKIYPNPTSDHVQVNFELSENANIKIQIVDMNGRYAQVLSDKQLEAGQHTISSDLDLPSGNYLITVQKGNEQLVNKLTIQ